jgi:hypothetical protein
MVTITGITLLFFWKKQWILSHNTKLDYNNSSSSNNKKEDNNRKIEEEK